MQRWSPFLCPLTKEGREFGPQRRILGLVVREDINYVLIERARAVSGNIQGLDIAEQPRQFLDGRGLHLPDAGQIRLTVGRAANWGAEVRLAIPRSRRAWRGVIQPLGRTVDGSCGQHDQDVDNPTL